MLYCFQLGRERDLAMAELASVLGDRACPVALVGDRLVVEARAPLDLAALQTRLGGTIGIAQVVAEFSQPPADEELVETLATRLAARSGRNFGLTLVGGDGRLGWNQRKLGLAIKRQLALRNSGRRLVTGRGDRLTSIIIRDQLLPPRGTEIIAISSVNGRVSESPLSSTSSSPSQLLIGVTETVQDWRGWSRRDYGRPARDPRRGMLPPKLARIMVNLAGAPASATILDPFCGSGTVLMEAALLGYRNLIGGDRDRQAIEATRQNFAWLRRTLGVVAAPRLLVSDVETLASQLHEPVDAVVTEADLGPADIARRTPAERTRIMNELEKRYHRWLAALHALIKPGGTVILAWPELRQPPIAFDLAPAARRLGWRVLPPIQDSWQNFVATRSFLSYARPEQTIGRRILTLQKNDRTDPTPTIKRPTDGLK